MPLVMGFFSVNIFSTPANAEASANARNNAIVNPCLIKDASAAKSV